MKTIHHVVDFEAAPDAIWDALTTEEGLSRWWSTVVDAEPPQLGAKIRFTFSGDFHPVMEVTELEGGHKLTWRCISGHDNWRDNTFPFELVALEDGRTRLRFSQHYAVELSDDDYGIYNFNWGYYLESLRLLCVEGHGKPFDPPGS
jgi:uncharacterized protein YndB with AHSA1/START domain